MRVDVLKNKEFISSSEAFTPSCPIEAFTLLLRPSLQVKASIGEITPKKYINK
jgi:hypothetical protein